MFYLHLFFPSLVTLKDLQIVLMVTMFFFAGAALRLESAFRGMCFMLAASLHCRYVLHAYFNSHLAHLDSETGHQNLTELKAFF